MADKYNLGTVGGGMIIKELFSGSVGSLTGVNNAKITLNDDFTNYKFLIFDFHCGLNGGTRYYSRVISVQQIINLFNDADNSTTISFCWGYGNTTDYFDIRHQYSTTKVLNTNSNSTQCIRIVGIN